MQEADKKLLELAEKATPGPWDWCHANAQCDCCQIHSIPADGVTAQVMRPEDEERYGQVPIDLEVSKANVRYIVAAANAVPRLLKRIDNLRARVPRHPLVRPVDGVLSPCGCLDCKEVERILATDDAAAKEQANG
jgi:hypothetical protein